MSRYPGRTSKYHWDLEAMSREQLQALSDERYYHPSKVKWGRYMFPDGPIYCTIAADLLLQIARKILANQRWESLYRQLPRFAQWRRKGLNIQGCILPGKKFRKYAPRPKRSKPKENTNGTL